MKKSSNGALSIIGSSLKQTAIPGLILWVVAATILISYILFEGLREALVVIADLKTKGSYLYSFIATAFFAGIIPGLYLIGNKAWGKGYRIKNMIALTLLWGVRGIEVDFFYRLQGFWFSDSSSLSTVLIKMSVDQFLYAPVLPALECSFIYGLMEKRYNLKKTFQGFDKTYWTTQYPAIILTNWMVWVPAVSVIYAMPAQLQIPVANIILCFWSLLFYSLSLKREKTGRNTSEEVIS